MVEARLNAAILIPAYNPDQKLLELLRQLSDTPVAQVIVVNDGSRPDCEGVFQQAQRIPKVSLLIHTRNLGKGAALKTGLRQLAAQAQPVAGVVTADADGQHTVADILQVAQQTLAHPEALVLGGRRFDRNVPWKSMAGNTITRWVLRLCFGLWIFDTQTGLRGIPAGLIPHFLEIPYNRFEFEQEMLLLCAWREIPVHEIPIRMVYFDQNRATHFHPVKDSLKIYFITFRYRIAWLLTWAADWLFFAGVRQLLPGILAPTLAARLTALLALYPFWAALVLDGNSGRKKGMHPFYRRFALLAMALGLVSAVLVHLLQVQTGGAILEDKVIAEVMILLVYALLPRGLKKAILPI